MFDTVAVIVYFVLMAATIVFLNVLLNNRCSEIDSLNEELIDLEDANEELRGKNEDLRRECGAAKRNRDDALESAESLDDIIATQREQLAALNKENNHILDENTSLTNALNASIAKIANLQAIIDDLDSENKNLAAENYRLEKLLASANPLGVTVTPLPESAVEMLTAKPSKSGKDWLAWLKQRNGK